MRSVYLDNSATTALDPRVLRDMMPFLTDQYGNAASASHQYGWRAMAAVEDARARLANLVGACHPSNIVFTSGATESINLALRGLKPASNRNHVVTSQIEHKAVLDSCRVLESAGGSITYVAPDSNGFVKVDDVLDAVRDDTGLVSIMTANNEVGSVQDIKAIGAACRERGIVFHTDATQALGKVDFDVSAMNVDLASFSGHKIYGPKGVGALYVDRAHLGGRIDAQIVGGGHEWGLRSGTLNVPGIVGFGAAVQYAVQSMQEEGRAVRALRDHLLEFIRSIPDVSINTEIGRSLPGLLNVSFDGIDADSLLLEMPEIALSSGSACTSANASPSHVLKAMGRTDRMAQASIRFSIGRFNTAEELSYVCHRLGSAVERLRAMAPTSKVDDDWR